MQAKSNPDTSSASGSRSDHVRKWRDCPPAFGRTPVKDLPHEIRSSEAEWQRLGESAWQVLLPSIDGDEQVDAIYNSSHWSHNLLARWLQYQKHPFCTAPAEECPTPHVAKEERVSQAAGA